MNVQDLAACLIVGIGVIRSGATIVDAYRRVAVMVIAIDMSMYFSDGSACKRQRQHQKNACRAPDQTLDPKANAALEYLERHGISMTDAEAALKSGPTVALQPLPRP